MKQMPRSESEMAVPNCQALRRRIANCYRLTGSGRGHGREYGITKRIRVCHGQRCHSIERGHYTRLANAAGDIALPHPDRAPCPASDEAP